MAVRYTPGAKVEPSALIEAVQSGSEVIIAKAGKPVARPRTPGAMAGEISIAADFNTLPDDMADAFEMKEPRG